MKQISAKFAVGLIAVLALLGIFTGCSDKPTGPSAGPNVSLDISYETMIPKLQQQINNVRLTITGIGIDTPIVVSTGVGSDGTFELVVDSVPAGPARVFTLELLYVIGVGAQSAQVAQGDIVLYRGVSSANVTADAQVTVPIRLVPTVPMLKLTPKSQEVPSGSTVYLDLVAYNLPTAVYANITFDFGYYEFFDYYLDPQPAPKPWNIPPGVDYFADLWVQSEGTEYQVQIGDLENFIPFTIPGPTVLATIPFNTIAFTDTTERTLPLYFTSDDFSFLDSTVINAFPDLGVPYLESSKVKLLALPDRPLFFPDTALTRVLKISLYDTELADTIWLSDAIRLLSFNGQGQKIQSISGIDQLKNLRDLYLGYTRPGVTDLRPLAGLPHLQQLTVDSTNVPDITPIANLKNLWYVSFNDNQISNLAPLGNLPNLQTVYLRNNRITDITPLIMNTGLIGQGDYVDLTGNTGIPTEQFAALRAKGVTVTGP